MPTTVGVISDTHGLIRQEALDALAGVTQILHAGDIGAPEVVKALEEIAPVLAIRGNVDTAEWTRAYPANRTVRIEDVHIFIVHDLAELDFDPAARDIAVVISGHSHKAHREERGGVLYLNPGSAGPRRFRLPITVARMEIDGDDAKAEIVTLAA